MQQPNENNKHTSVNSPQNPLNESPASLMRSWQQLRELDCNLAEQKYNDLATGEKPARQKRR
ncbi:hypothetical protein [Pontibacter liquoris]|uniref:hypothetical protein n=1 Tax=Pontibacter liquoris TaxID=2905677 RepID=UPI001FA70226|nr:hypothetical protein [Pontibacter liquoris]